MKKTKKIRPHNIDGIYVLSKDKKLSPYSRSDNTVIDVTMKDIERIYLYSKQREKELNKKYKTNPLGIFVVRLSEDVHFIVDNRRKK
jgi:hypothetical protein